MAEEFRGVCREAIMANLDSPRTVRLEDLEGEISAMELSAEEKQAILEDEKRAVGKRSHAEWDSLRVAPFPPDNLGDQTPLVSKRMTPVTQISRSQGHAALRRPERSERPRGEPDVPWEAGYSPAAAPISLLPAPSAAHQMPVPGGDLPSVLLLEGFRTPNLNQAFHFNNQILVCGHPTYWNRDRSYFSYFHRQDERWVISPRMQNGLDTLKEAQNGVTLGCAYQYPGDLWHEFSNEDWMKAPQVRVTPLVEQTPARLPGAAQPLPRRMLPPPRAAAPVATASSEREMSSHLASVAKTQKQAFAVDTVHIRGGFLNSKLNTVYYVDSSVQVGFRSTYWDDQRRFFMYYQAAMKRWAISIRIHDTKTGKDMLEHAKGGGLCGFAFEVDKVTNQWKEFYGGKWVSVQIDIQKLCTGKGAPNVARAFTGSNEMPPPETPLSMAAKHEQLPAVPAVPFVPAVPSVSGGIQTSKLSSLGASPKQMNPPKLNPNPPSLPKYPSHPLRPKLTPPDLPSVSSAPSAVPKTSSEKQMAAQPLERLEVCLETLEVKELKEESPEESPDGHLKGEDMKEEIEEVEVKEKEVPSDDESHEEKRNKYKDGKENKDFGKVRKDKKTKKLEKQERARKKENKMKEKIRQEMLAAQANKPSNTKGGWTPGGKKNSPKKARKAALELNIEGMEQKAKRRRKSMEAPAARPRWKASIAAKWPACYEENAVTDTAEEDVEETEETVIVEQEATGDAVQQPDSNSHEGPSPQTSQAMS